MHICIAPKNWLVTTFKVKRSKVNLQGAGAYCGGLRTACYYCESYVGLAVC